MVCWLMAFIRLRIWTHSSRANHACQTAEAFQVACGEGGCHRTTGNAWFAIYGGKIIVFYHKKALITVKNYYMKRFIWWFFIILFGWKGLRQPMPRFFSVHRAGIPRAHLCCGCDIWKLRILWYGFFHGWYDAPGLIPAQKPFIEKMPWILSKQTF